MQKPVRYYIVKADDQPVVRSVPVSVPAATPSARPVATDATVDHADGAIVASTRAADARRRTRRPERARENIARLMRAAIRRNHRGR